MTFTLTYITSQSLSITWRSLYITKYYMEIPDIYIYSDGLHPRQYNITCVWCGLAIWPVCHPLNCLAYL